MKAFLSSSFSIGIPLLPESHFPKSVRKKHGVSADGMPEFDIKESSAFLEFGLQKFIAVFLLLARISVLHKRKARPKFFAYCTKRRLYRDFFMFVGETACGKVL